MEERQPHLPQVLHPPWTWANHQVETLDQPITMLSLPRSTRELILLEVLNRSLTWSTTNGRDVVWENRFKMCPVELTVQKTFSDTFIACQMMEGSLLKH